MTSAKRVESCEFMHCLLWRGKEGEQRQKDLDGRVSIRMIGLAFRRLSISMVGMIMLRLMAFGILQDRFVDITRSQFENFDI